MDKQKLFKEFFQPLVVYYGYPPRLKNDNDKKEFCDEYLVDLLGYKNIEWMKVKSYLKDNHIYFPKLKEVKRAVEKFLPVTDPKQVYKKRMDDERIKRKLRATVREDIYNSNTNACEKIIQNGWGLQLACAISDMFETAYRRNQHELLAKDANARIHYSPSICQGKDPLYYYYGMNVNEAGLKAMAEHPVEFIRNVMS